MFKYSRMNGIWHIHLITKACLYVTEQVLPDLKLGHHQQGTGEGQGGQQRGGGHEEHLADGHLGGLDTGILITLY